MDWMSLNYLERSAANNRFYKGLGIYLCLFAVIGGKKFRRAATVAISACDDPYLSSTSVHCSTISAHSAFFKFIDCAL